MKSGNNETILEIDDNFQRYKGSEYYSKLPLIIKRNLRSTMVLKEQQIWIFSNTDLIKVVFVLMNTL